MTRHTREMLSFVMEVLVIHAPIKKIATQNKLLNALIGSQQIRSHVKIEVRNVLQHATFHTNMISNPVRITILFAEEKLELTVRKKMIQVNVMTTSTMSVLNGMK